MARVVALVALGALAAALAACGGDGVQTRTIPADPDVASRPAVGQAAALARIGTLSVAPVADLADPDSGPEGLRAAGRELDELARRSVRVSDDVERTDAPLPNQVLAAAKLQQRALERGALLAGKLADLEDEADGQQKPSKEAREELTALADDVDDLRPLAVDVADLQDDQLAAQRRLMRSAWRAANQAGVARPRRRTQGLRADPQLQEDLTAAVADASERISTQVAALAPAPEPTAPATPVSTTVPANTVLQCGDDPELYRVQALNLSCGDANQLARAAVGALAPTFGLYGYSCEILGQYFGPEPGVYEGADDVLCRQGEQAFQFDFID